MAHGLVCVMCVACELGGAHDRVAGELCPQPARRPRATGGGREGQRRHQVPHRGKEEGRGRGGVEAGGCGKIHIPEGRKAWWDSTTGGCHETGLALGKGNYLMWAVLFLSVRSEWGTELRMLGEGFAWHDDIAQNLGGYEPGPAVRLSTVSRLFHSLDVPTLCQGLSTLACLPLPTPPFEMYVLSRLAYDVSCVCVCRRVSRGRGSVCSRALWHDSRGRSSSSCSTRPRTNTHNIIYIYIYINQVFSTIQ